MKCPDCGSYYEKEDIINIDRNSKVLIYYFQCGYKVELKKDGHRWSPRVLHPCNRRPV
jgi:hypothetical protein